MYPKHMTEPLIEMNAVGRKRLKSQYDDYMSQEFSRPDYESNTSNLDSSDDLDSSILNKPIQKPKQLTRLSTVKPINFFCKKFLPIFFMVMISTLLIVFDYELCFISAESHSIVLNKSSSIPPQQKNQYQIGKTYASYLNNESDIVEIKKQQDGTQNAIYQTFILSMLVNYTQFENANRNTIFNKLLITNSSDQLKVTTTSPDRKRILLPQAWFSYQYWQSKANYNNNTKEEQCSLLSSVNTSLTNIPLWIMNLNEAGRGRSGNGVCDNDYGLKLELPQDQFCYSSILIRQIQTSVEFNNSKYNGQIILDLHTLTSNITNMYFYGSNNIQTVLPRIKTQQLNLIFENSTNKELKNNITIKLYRPVENCTVENVNEVTYNSQDKCKMDLYGVISNDMILHYVQGIEYIDRFYINIQTEEKLPQIKNLADKVIQITINNIAINIDFTDAQNITCKKTDGNSYQIACYKS
ncbi:Conserved_hypothetical protein [Hexamita inflata]|uniref:Uncharacterized protein n=1 Tax=Hexamita inflata TaxID=28002 RepID=A0AA86P3Z3_9EUKA|nr:Conserved hypothetical protein [Hexamita inflata]